MKTEFWYCVRNHASCARGVDPDTVLPVPSELPEPEESPVKLVLDMALLYADRDPVVKVIGDPGLSTDVPHSTSVGLHPADPTFVNGY